MPSRDSIRRQYGDVAVTIFKKLSTVEQKLVKTSNQLTFLIRCRDLHIIPKGLRIKTPVNSRSANKIGLQASKRLVKERIRHHRANKARYTEQANNLTDCLKSAVSPDTFDQLRTVQTEANMRLHDKTKNVHRKKLAALTTTTKTNECRGACPKQTRKTVVNLSSRALSKDEQTVLEKGLNYVPTTKPKNQDDFITNVEKGLQQLAPGGKIDYLRHQIAETLLKSQHQRSNLTNNERNAIRQLKQDKDITVLPADKGRATVVMNTVDYNDKVEKMLSDTKTYQKLRKDPTTKLDRQHKSRLKRLRDNKELDQRTYDKLNTSHPQPPYARATVKIHKDPIKMRLLVCSRDTVFYSTAQYMANLLSPLGKMANSYVKDSRDFCKKIQDITTPGKIVSYDVIDLFTNIPRQEALETIKARVTQAKDQLDTTLTIDSIVELINSCITSTYFTWGDQVFEQLHGLPMGSPLSPIVTEIYMTSFEERALLTAPVTPACWYRKVDDVFAILNETDDPETLLNHLNTQSNHIKFTMETESENQLPFLDVLVTRTTDGLQTSVYRKPTHTDQYVHFKSNHPTSVKVGIINTLARRAIEISSTPESRETELNHIEEVLTTHNGYPLQLVKDTINRTMNKMTCHGSGQPKVREDVPIFVTLPFRGAVSYQVKRLLENLACVKVVFSKQNTIKHMLNANGRKPTTHQSDQKGTVYKITCSCDSVYIGETGRPLSVRIKEHQKSVQKADGRSALSDHILANPKHTIKWNSVEKLDTNQNNTIARKLNEAVQIARYKPALNRDNGLFIPNAYESLIKCQRINHLH